MQSAVAVSDPYHGDYEHLSKTMLTQFMDDRVKFEAYYVSKTRNPPDLSAKSNVSIGDVVHQCLLEGKDMDQVAVTYPEDCFKSNGHLNPKPAKEFRERFEGYHILKDIEWRRCINTVNAVLRHDLGKVLGTPGTVFEQPIRWTDPTTGVKCRCKPDFMFEDTDKVICYDLKVTEVIYPKQWRKVSRNFKYWLQDAHYSSGLAEVTGKPVQFVFWAVESMWPHRIVRYEYDKISRERAGGAYLKALQDLDACRKSGDWKEDWEKQNNELLLSPWEVDEEEEELEGFDDDE